MQMSRYANSTFSNNVACDKTSIIGIVPCLGKYLTSTIYVLPFLRTINWIIEYTMYNKNLLFALKFYPLTICSEKNPVLEAACLGRKHGAKSARVDFYIVQKMQTFREYTCICKEIEIQTVR